MILLSHFFYKTKFNSLDSFMAKQSRKKTIIGKFNHINYQDLKLVMQNLVINF